MKRIDAWKLTITLCGLLVPAMVAVGACGGDDSAPAGRGGASPAGAGGSTGLGGAAAGTGGTGTGLGGSPTGTGGAPSDASASADGFPAACTPYTVPNQNITDFAIYSMTGAWGDTMSLQGGTFTYTGTGDVPTTTLDADAGNLVVSVTVPAGSYAGFGFYFGPACVNAASYSGMTFTIGGSLGGAQAIMQMQTDEDYPVDAVNLKGHCPGTFSAGCGFPSATFLVTDTPTPTSLPFSLFTGGKPMATVDPQKLVGLQWQFNCPASDAATDCVVSFSLDDVHFVM
jgi:hypothetical protein